jgi:hypothetical protein
MGIPVILPRVLIATVTLNVSLRNVVIRKDDKFCGKETHPMSLMSEKKNVSGLSLSLMRRRIKCNKIFRNKA